jgi:hypothetical protein
MTLSKLFFYFFCESHYPNQRICRSEYASHMDQRVKKLWVSRKTDRQVSGAYTTQQTQENAEHTEGRDAD